jgi:hypothetical protein
MLEQLDIDGMPISRLPIHDTYWLHWAMDYLIENPGQTIVLGVKDGLFTYSVKPEQAGNTEAR